MSYSQHKGIISTWDPFSLNGKGVISLMYILSLVIIIFKQKLGKESVDVNKFCLALLHADNMVELWVSRWQLRPVSSVWCLPVV